LDKWGLKAGVAAVIAAAINGMASSQLPTGPQSGSAADNIVLSLQGSLVQSRGVKQGSGSTFLMKGMYRKFQSSLPVMVKLHPDQRRANWEYEVLQRLYRSKREAFVEPLDLLDFTSPSPLATVEFICEEGDRMVLSQDSERREIQRLALSSVFVMERGNQNLAEYIRNNRNQLLIHDLIGIVERLTDILITAHDCGYVILDFKPENVVLFSTSGFTYYKAIDFDCCVTVGTDARNQLCMP
jgi:serine/threonine protein kinase